MGEWEAVGSQEVKDGTGDRPNYYDITEKEYNG
jgi:hypothetical protein